MAKNVPRVTLTFAAAETEDTCDKISQNEGVYQGQACLLYVAVGNSTAVVTLTLSLKDKNGSVLWTSAALAKNANYSIPVDLPLVEQETIYGLLSDVPGEGGLSATIDMSFIPDRP